MTAFALSKQIEKELECDDCSFDSRMIVEKVCGISHDEYLLKRNREVSEEEKTLAFEMAKKRNRGIPLRYLLGRWEFCGFEFEVGEGVLIPRPETEELVFAVADLLKEKKNPIVFDLCSGSGCIGLSLKHLCPEATVYLVELSEKAIPFIERNKAKNGFEKPIVSGEVVLVGYDILKGFPDFLPKPDVIVSNPPYINSAEIQTLQKEVLFEPKMALDGGEDGLVFYRCLSEKWFPYINENGFIAVECGENRAEQIAKMFGPDSKIKKDFYGTDRFVFGFA